MPFQNPFTAVVSRHAVSLFEIRLDSDFVVFRGNDNEAGAQLLKGNVVLCLKDHIRVEDVHLRLQGNCRLAWVEGKPTPTGIHNQKVDKTNTLVKHSWPPFVGDGSHHTTTLQPGNYEWPFELTLPGDTPESVEGLYQTGIFYMLKATISRGKLAKNHHAYKRVRIVRTLDPSALEFNHAMSVENIWPNKIEYSISVPQKAIVFGTNIPLEMRFTPLLKGLDLGNITVKLIETQDFTVSGYSVPSRSHRNERDVTAWNFGVSREEHWLDNIEETGQEGWMVTRDLELPKKLGRCIQDCTVPGIKIRHKIKLIVALKNPDGHVSELRATLPVTIFISPNIPLDDEGNLVSQAPASPGERSQRESELRNPAPPGYGAHVLDQLYDEVDPTGIMTPSGVMTPGAVTSGVNSPFYAQSRAGSSENLAALSRGMPVPPAALSSRLQQHASDNEPNRNSRHGHPAVSGETTPFTNGHENENPMEWSNPHSVELSRRTSEEEQSHPNTPPEPEHAEYPSMEQLSKVPSYTTATRGPLPRTASFTGAVSLPDYQTALSTPTTPIRTPTIDPLSTIGESQSGNTSEGTLGFQFIPSQNEGHGNRHSRNLSAQRGGH